jgi:hypothetical protein
MRPVPSVPVRSGGRIGKTVGQEIVSSAISLSEPTQNFAADGYSLATAAFSEDISRISRSSVRSNSSHENRKPVLHFYAMYA